MYYRTKLVDSETCDERRRPVTEIYVNTQYKDTSDEKLMRLSKMMELFKNPDSYDDDAFPRLSDRKRHLKTTQEGVMDMSCELQEYIDSELQEYIDSEKAEARRQGKRQGRRQGRRQGKKAGIAIGKNNTAKLMAWLSSSGRADDIIKASEDEAFLDRLLEEFATKTKGAD